MRVLFLGGTRVVGPAAAQLTAQRGHDVAIAHTGAHEHPGVADFEHLHGGRSVLLEAGGAVDRWRPDVLVDTFAGGATAERAHDLLAAAVRGDVRTVVAISSIDVYQYCVEAGSGDGSGATDLPRGPLPLDEAASVRTGPDPGRGGEHDNARMEAALATGRSVTALRLGAVYGPFARTREWTIVERVHRGERDLPLPDGGTQLWPRVALERVARAIVAAAERGGPGVTACNVVDPQAWTYAALCAEVGRLLDWEWEPRRVPFSATNHAWQTVHPVVCSDARLRYELGVTEPDPADALAETVAWLWEHRHALADGTVRAPAQS